MLGSVVLASVHPVPPEDVVLGAGVVGVMYRVVVNLYQEAVIIQPQPRDVKQ